MATDYTTRKDFTPVPGTVYENTGGGEFLCIEKLVGKKAKFINVKSGWVLTATGVAIYNDGRIDWDYSKDGHFDQDALNVMKLMAKGEA